ncbi:MAG: sulfite exporter TauE/SafE family protein [Gemmatimonadetes bacterium]|nr:sulfite exporter TauE/SafE family protein [Gemmatimonadota bacterium]
MSIERVMQRILLALVAMAIAASAWGDEIGEAGRLSVGTVAAEDGETDALTDMLRSEELSLGLIVGALALALFLGAAHGLEPGHGKTIVAAYLVGARGTVGNALFLGGVVALTHTSSVILLGLVALFASQYILPEQIFPWLGTASGFLIMGLGTWLLVNHLRGRSPGHSHAHREHLHEHNHEEEHLHEHVHSHAHGEYLHEHTHEEEYLHEHVHSHAHGEHLHEHSHEEEYLHEHVHSHAHGEHHHVPSHSHEEEHHHGHGHSHEEEHHGHPHGEHHHGHSHSHEIPNKVTLGSLLTLGISGGIVPCTGALVILLLAVALHRIAFGLLLLVTFSVGLAAVLIAIGVLIVKARPLVERFSGDGRWIQRLPIASAVVIIVVGLGIALNSLGIVD